MDIDEDIGRERERFHSELIAKVSLIIKIY